MTEELEAIAKRLVLRQKRDGRNMYDPRAKAELLSLARQPGVSLAKIARVCGMNANVLSKWILQAESGASKARATGGEVIDIAAPTFIAMKVEGSARGQAPSRGWELQVRLPNGVSVEVRGYEADGALRVIEALGRLRCSGSTIP
jgi:transposase